MKIQKPACIRYKVTDVRLYKLGQVPGLEWSQRWSNRTLKDMTTWANDKSITIQVSEGYTPTPLKLVVCEFKPVKGDVLERSWVPHGGTKKSVAIPPFAIKDLSAAKEAYMQYINNGGAEFFKGALDPKEVFLWKTYSMAISTSDDVAMVGFPLQTSSNADTTSLILNVDSLRWFSASGSPSDSVRNQPTSSALKLLVCPSTSSTARTRRPERSPYPQ